MTRYARLTDIHLEFLGSQETVAFVKELAAQKLDRTLYYRGYFYCFAD